MRSILDPALKAMLDQAALMPAPPLESLPIGMVRAGAGMLGDPLGAAIQMETRAISIPGGGGAIPARLYVPNGAAPSGPGLVYFHGGGFIMCGLDTHDPLCRRLARASGVRILSVDYRLAPEHVFPACFDDAQTATEWAFDHALEIGFDSARIGVGGDSAGGALAASTAIAMRRDVRRKIAFQLLLYPVTDLHAQPPTPSRKALADGFMISESGMRYFQRCLFGDTGMDASPRASVLLEQDLSGLPPAHVVTAGFDPLKDEGRLYAEKMQAASVKAKHVEYPAFIHAFYNMGSLSPTISAAIDETAGALRAGLGG